MTCMSIRVTLIQCSERGGSSAEAQDIHLGGGHWITKWVSNITMKGADVGRCVGITFLTRHRYWRLQDGVWRGYTPGRIGSRRYWQNERKTGLTGRLLETSKGRNMCIDDAIPPLPFPPWFTLRTETLSIRHLEWPMPTIMQLATSGQKTKKIQGFDNISFRQYKMYWQYHYMLWQQSEYTWETTYLAMFAINIDNLDAFCHVPSFAHLCGKAYLITA